MVDAVASDGSENIEQLRTGIDPRVEPNQSDSPVLTDAEANRHLVRRYVVGRAGGMPPGIVVVHDDRVTPREAVVGGKGEEDVAAVDRVAGGVEGGDRLGGVDDARVVRIRGDRTLREGAELVLR